MQCTTDLTRQSGTTRTAVKVPPVQYYCYSIVLQLLVPPLHHYTTTVVQQRCESTAPGYSYDSGVTHPPQ
eukprot:9479156-Pyramimonas_sp.AAC.1